jgi:hypothetical protein
MRTKLVSPVVSSGDGVTTLGSSFFVTVFAIEERPDSARTVHLRACHSSDALRVVQERSAL